MKTPDQCRCLDPLVFVDEPQHCFRCGKGPLPIRYADRPRRTPRLPRDLGSLQREGRRPDLMLDNVVRLDNLRRSLDGLRRAA